MAYSIIRDWLLSDWIGEAMIWGIRVFMGFIILFILWCAGWTGYYLTSDHPLSALIMAICLVANWVNLWAMSNVERSLREEKR